MFRQRANRIKAAVSLLEKLAKLRFPEPSPDLFTLRDFKERYPLTQLGPLAVQAMEKSQRISRQQRDYSNIGLCEFHIGLIYLSNQDCLGGVQHFNNAHHQWHFINEPSGMALGYFAQGLAQHLNWQYEAAMGSFNQVRRWLPRMSFEAPTQSQMEFVKMLSEELERAYVLLRNELWQFKAAQGDDDAAHDEEADSTLNSMTVAPPQANTDEQTADSHPAPSDTPETPAPPSSTTLDIIVENEAEKTAETNRPPAPFPQLPHFFIPGHNLNDANYAWYLVMSAPPTDFFPVEIQEGSGILVNKQPWSHMRGGELVVVGHKDARLLDQDAVRVQPISGISQFPILTIAWLDLPDSGDDDQAMAQVYQAKKRVDLTTSPEMKLIPTRKEQIIGVVVGTWHPVTIRG